MYLLHTYGYGQLYKVQVCKIICCFLSWSYIYAWLLLLIAVTKNCHIIIIQYRTLLHYWTVNMNYLNTSILIWRQWTPAWLPCHMAPSEKPAFVWPLKFIIYFFALLLINVTCSYLKCPSQFILFIIHACRVKRRLYRCIKCCLGVSQDKIFFFERQNQIKIFEIRHISYYMHI